MVAGPIVVVLGGLWVACAASAATTVPAGPLSGDLTWTSDGSPYTLTGMVTVPAGAVLTIESAARIEGHGGAGLVVEGTVRVLGVQGGPVIMEAVSTLTPWECLEVRGEGNATIFNGTIRGCNVGLRVNTTGAVVVADSAIVGPVFEGVFVTGDSAGVGLFNVTVSGGSTSLRAEGGLVKVSVDASTFDGALQCVQVTSASLVTVTRSVLSDCGNQSVILVLVTDVLLDHNTMDGWTVAGVDGQSVTRVTVTDNALRGGLGIVGVRLLGAAESRVEGNVIEMLANRGDTGTAFSVVGGVVVGSPLGTNVVSGNTITAEEGILIRHAIFEQRVEANVIHGGVDTGIEILDSPNQTVRGNVFDNRSIPFAVNVTSLGTPWYYRQYVDGTNTIDGRPIRYLVDRSDEVIDLSDGTAMVALVNARNVTLENGVLAYGTPSVLVAWSSDIAVRRTTVNASFAGVAVVGSTRVTLEGLSVRADFACFQMAYGRQNHIDGANVTTCRHVLLTEAPESDLLAERIVASQTGPAVFFGGTNLVFRDSSFTVASTAVSNVAFLPQRRENGGGAIARPGDAGGVRVINVSVLSATTAVWLVNASLVEVRGMDVSQTLEGFHLENVTRLLVNGSNISATYYGMFAQNLQDSVVEGSMLGGAFLEAIKCMDCQRVTFAANLFVGNQAGLFLRGGSGCLVTRNLFFDNAAHGLTNTSDNLWDDGAIGNLWDDYNGSDANGDGIGEAPYPISSGVNQDRHPIVLFVDDVPPTADAGADVFVFEDEPVLLSGYQSSDDVGIRAYLWSFVHGGQAVTVVGLSTRYLFQTPGVFVVTLTVIDWGGNRAQDQLVVTVFDRTAPHARAGGDRTVDEDTPLVLDGAASFDNDPKFPQGAAFTWVVADLNGSFTLYGPVVGWTFSTPGSYLVRLVVIDAVDLADSDWITVTVRDKTPPVVGPLQDPLASEDTPFRAYGSAVTDNDPQWPDGMVGWFELWHQASLIDSSGESPAVFGVADPGEYRIVYFVSDAAGNVGSSNLTFRVADITPPDVTLLGDRQAEAGVRVEFDISLVTDNDPAFTAEADVTWSILLGSSRILLLGGSVGYTFPQIGDFTVTLSVRDPSGNEAERSFLAHVRDTRPPAVSIEGPLSVEAGQLVTFTANASDPSGVEDFVWTVTGALLPHTAPSFSYRFPSPGSFDLRVTVEDPLGHAGVATLTVVVVDTTAPTVAAQFTPASQNGSLDAETFQTVQAAFTGTDNVQVAVVEWAWGDGNVSDGALAWHAYGAPGNYTILLRVSDAQGNSGTATYRVLVVTAQGPGPGGGNATGPEPTGGLPVVALAALVVGGVAAGLALGMAIGRKTRRPPEGEA